MIRYLLTVAGIFLAVTCLTPTSWVGLAAATLAIGITGGCAVGGLAARFTHC